MTGPRRRVLVPRGAGTEKELVAALEARGAEPVTIPLIEMERVLDSDEVRAALREAVRKRSEIAVTSRFAADLLSEAAPEPAAWAGSRIWAVGSETGARLPAAPSVSNAGPGGAGLAAAMILAGVGAGSRVWLPRAERADPSLERALAGAGADITTTVLYRTRMPSSAASRLRLELERGLDAVLLTSPSTARHFAEVAGTAEGIQVICIGPTTAAAAIGCGMHVTATAETPDTKGLVAALQAHAPRANR